MIALIVLTDPFNTLEVILLSLIPKALSLHTVIILKFVISVISYLPLNFV